MPFGSWGQTIRNRSAGLYGYQQSPSNPFDPNSQVQRSGGSPGYFGVGQDAVAKRQFADVGKVNLNLANPLATGEGSSYLPVDSKGPLGGLESYYSAQTPGGLFAGLGAALGQTVGGLFGQGGAKTGSDIGTFVGKTVEAPLAAVGSIGVPFVAPVIDDMNAEIEKVTPYILRDTLKIPTNVGGAFQSMLNVFGLLGRGIERTFAGSGIRGPLPEDIQKRVDSGELSPEQGLDELVMTGRGFTDDPWHNMVLSIATDPANWISGGIGAVGGAVRGTSAVARTFGAAARATDVGGAALRAAVGGMPELQNLAEAAQRGEALTPLVRNRATLNQMRAVLDDTNNPVQLRFVERAGMSALGPVSDTTGNTVLRLGNYILRATDPVNFFSGSKAGKRSMEQLNIAASTGVMAAYKPLVVNDLLRLADGITSDGSDRVLDALGIHGANLLQEVGISEMASDAMRTGAIPKVDSLTATEAVRGVLRGGGYDANIGKYVETLTEQHKDLAVLRLAPQEMSEVTHAKLASMLGTDVGTVAARMGDVSDDQAMLVHALYYYAKGKVLHTDVRTALEQARNAGTLGKDIDPGRVAIISPRTLTKQRAHLIHTALKTGDAEEVRRVTDEFEDFDWLNRKNVEDSDVIQIVGDYMKANEPALYDEILLVDPTTGLPRTDIPPELTQWASDGDSFNYRLGQRMPEDVPLEAQWRTVRDSNGDLVNVKPYLDFWAEGDPARKLGRFDALRMGLTRSVRQERVIWQQRRSFITDMAKHAEKDPAWVNVPPDVSSRLWQALMYRAEDLGVQPRGMDPREIGQTVRRVLKDIDRNSQANRNMGKKLTERQVVLALLRATHGEISTVGATQWITGGIKAKAPGAGVNYWGRIAERLYPLMRFTLNPVFQTMELFEPYILNTLRGIHTPLNRNSEDFKSALATHNAVQQLARNSTDPDGLMAETAEALAISATEHAYAATNFGPRSRLGRLTSPLRNSIGNVAARKNVAAAIETQRIMGDNLYAAFKSIKGDEFEAYWADLERMYDTTNWGELAMKWLTGNFTLQDLDGNRVGLIADLLQPKNLGQRFRLTATGERGSYTFADVEEVLDIARRHRTNSLDNALPAPFSDEGLASGEALVAHLKDIDLHTWLREMDDHGFGAHTGRVSDVQAETIWRMANGPELKGFWKGYRDTYLQNVTGTDARWTRLARDLEVVMARSMVRAWAQAKNMTEEEFVKLHFDDIPRLLASQTPVSVGSLTDIRANWAGRVMGRTQGGSLTDAKMIQYYRQAGDTHSAEQYLDADRSGHFYFGAEEDEYDRLMRQMAEGNEASLYYSVMGVSPTRIINDAYGGGTHILRLRRHKVQGDVVDTEYDDLGNVEYHDINRHLDVVADEVEILTDTGWERLTSRVADPITPRGPDFERRERLSLLYPGHADRMDEGIYKVDFDQLLTQSERKATIDYGGVIYANINTYLRGVPMNPNAALAGRFTDDELDQMVEWIDGAIQKGRSANPMTLYRGINIGRLKTEFGGYDATIDYENMQVGDTYADPAFVSTSDTFDTAYNFSSSGGHVYAAGTDHVGVVVQMEMPGGFNMNLHLTGSGETEHLLGRDIPFKVVSRREEAAKYGKGKTIFLNVRPVGAERLPGVNRLAWGEAPTPDIYDTMLRQEALANPDSLLTRSQGVAADTNLQVDYYAEEAIADAAKAKAALGPVREIGGRKFGELSPEDILDGITSHLDVEEIEAGRLMWSDLRERIHDLLSTSNLVDEWGMPTTGLDSVSMNQDAKFMAALVPSIIEDGDASAGLSRLTFVMERLWSQGTGMARSAYRGGDDVTNDIAAELLRGAKKALPQRTMYARVQDAVDVMLGNTTRRANGRVDQVQPVFVDDVVAEAAGYLTPNALYDLLEHGVDTTKLAYSEIGPAEHEYIVDLFNRAAQRANEAGLGGFKGWTAADIATLAARSREAQGRVTSTTLMADTFDDAMTMIPAEIYPGRSGTKTAKLAPLLDILNQRRYRAERSEVLREVQTAMAQRLRDEFGIIIDQYDDIGIGVFDEATPQPLVTVHSLSTQNGAEGLADALAYAMDQQEVWAWSRGPSADALRVTNDFGRYDPRVTITLSSDIPPRIAEKYMAWLGTREPFIKGMTALPTADGGWDIHIIDREGKLPRLDSMEVDETKLMEQLQQSADEFAGTVSMAAELLPEVRVGYGRTYVGGPTRLEDGSLDWDGHLDQVTTRAKERGTPVGAGQFDSLRSAYERTLQDSLRDQAPTNYRRLLNGEAPTRNLEDARGGNVLGTTTGVPYAPLPGGPAPAGSAFAARSGANTPRAVAAAVLRGFSAADPLTGFHELVHAFSLTGADSSLREVVQKAYDEFVTAGEQEALKWEQKAAAATTNSVRSRFQNNANAIRAGLQKPHPEPWGNHHEEFLVHALLDWVDNGLPDNPELANVFGHFKNWLSITRKEMDAGRPKGMPPVAASPQMQAVFNRMLAPTRVPRATVSYSLEQQAMRTAGLQTLRSAWNEAHATQFYKRDRSMLERSINHPYIGLYPASYMWGKVLPEMVRFLALRPFGMETPFLAWNVTREISDSIRTQSETDEDFRKFLETNKEAWQLFSMLFPALPQDIPANASLPIRRVAEQGLEAQAKFARGVQAGGGRGQVHPIDYAKGAMDAVSYALGPLGTIRTVNDIAGMSGEFIQSGIDLASGEAIGEGTDRELLPFR